MATAPPRPVVVGVDGSESALAAVAWGARHASRAGLPLRLVHAFCWPLVRTSDAPSRWTRGPRSEAWTYLDKAKHRAFEVAPEITVTQAVPTSFAATLLLRESERASLVVVGTHGLGGLGGLVIGSTGVELAVRASSPIVVVRGRPADQISAKAPVVVGYDDSAASELVVATGFEYAALHGRSVVLLHARRHRGEEPRMCERMLDVAARWRRVHPEVETVVRVVTGRPGAALTEASEAAGLLIAGSRGREGFRGPAMGSVSQALLHHADCPVEILSPYAVRNAVPTDSREAPRAVNA